MRVTVRRAVVWVEPLQGLQSVDDLRFGHAGQAQALQEVDLFDGVAWLHLTALHSGICIHNEGCTFYQSELETSFLNETLDQLCK